MYMSGLIETVLVTASGSFCVMLHDYRLPAIFSLILCKCKALSKQNVLKCFATKLVQTLPRDQTELLMLH